MNDPLGAGRICIKMAPALRSSAEISAKGSAGIIICQGRQDNQRDSRSEACQLILEGKNLIYVSEDASEARGRF